jgi:phospholipid/cholesterol/gamma-HCH transport system substrate-binding protein
MIVSEKTETLAGACVVALGLLLFFLVSGRNVGMPESGNLVHAEFRKVDGINLGAEVRMAGIKVGQVVAQALADNYQAKLVLQLDDDIRLPIDTAAIIETDGLLGAKYIELQPGGDESVIPSGGSISYSQDSIIVEELLSKVISISKSRRGSAEMP